MHKKYIDFWWSKGTKNITLINYKKPWKENNISPMFCIKTNGAKKKNGDTCLAFSIYLGYLIFNYTNFNLQGKRG